MAIETCGALWACLGHQVTLDAYQYLVQRISVAVQHGNAASVLKSLGDKYCDLETLLLMDES